MTKALFSDAEIRLKCKYLGHKLRRENEQGLSKEECIKELGSFLTAIGASRATRAELLASHIKKFK